MFTNTEFTPRNVAKHVAQALVAAKVADLAADAISDHTAIDEDSRVLKITTGGLGWGVSSKLQPYTDRLVDLVADKIDAHKQARQENTETPE